MLLFWCLVNLYLVTFFAIMGLVGVGYLIGFAVKRVRARRLEPRGLPGIRRALTEDALKAA